MDKRKQVTAAAGPLSNIETAVMGLLFEGARYGYEIEKVIEQRHMRYWTEVGFSSIYYVLKRMETKRFIKSEMKAGADGKPARKIYTMTPAGKTAFKAKVTDLLSADERVVSPFDLGITFCEALSAPELSACFAKRLEFLSTQLDWTQKLFERGKTGNRRPGVIAKFSRRMAIIKAETAWIREFVRTLD
jgi:DNA-binding PadR family transcriptional regulator